MKHQTGTYLASKVWTLLGTLGLVIKLMLRMYNYVYWSRPHSNCVNLLFLFYIELYCLGCVVLGKYCVILCVLYFKILKCIEWLLWFRNKIMLSIRNFSTEEEIIQQCKFYTMYWKHNSGKLVYWFYSKVIILGLEQWKIHNYVLSNDKCWSESLPCCCGTGYPGSELPHEQEADWTGSDGWSSDDGGNEHGDDAQVAKR